MMLREEFANTVGWISESVDTIIVTAQDMMESEELKFILYLVLLTGNFLNAVSYRLIRSVLGSNVHPELNCKFIHSHVACL